MLARHGDIFDPLSFGDDRDAASLNDVIAIELIARFLQHVETEMADQIVRPRLAALCEIDQIRPHAADSGLDRMHARTDAPTPVDSQPHQADLGLHGRADRCTWKSFAACGEASPVDLIDGLAAALKFSRRDSHNWIGRTLSVPGRACAARQSPSYAQHALAEADFRNRRARHIVYGHTHQHEIVPLDASHADGYVLNQTYFNAGTWRRSYQPTQMLAGQHELVASDSFSLLAFYQGDERSGRGARNVERHAGTDDDRCRGVASGSGCCRARSRPAACAAIRRRPLRRDGPRLLTQSAAPRPDQRCGEIF